MPLRNCVISQSSKSVRPPTCKQTLLKLLQLFADCGRGEWQEDTLLSDRFLTLAAQNEPQELRDLRIERFTWRAIEIEIHRPAERIGAIRDSLQREWNVGRTVLRRERKSLHLGCLFVNAAVGDRVLILAEVLHHESVGRDNRLVVLIVGIRVLFQVAVPASPIWKRRAAARWGLQHLKFEECCNIVSRGIPEDMDWLVRPFARQTKLTPGANVSPRSAAEDQSKLRQRESRDRILLVDEHANRESLVLCVETAGSSRNLRRLVLEHPAEREVFQRRNLAAQQSNVRDIEH